MWSHVEMNNDENTWQQFNSLRLDAYHYHLDGLFDAKQLLEPRLTYCQMNPKKRIHRIFNQHIMLFSQNHAFENVICTTLSFCQAQIMWNHVQGSM